MRTLSPILAVALVPALSASAHGQIPLTDHPRNPIVRRGPFSAWDSGIVFMPSVVVHKGAYYLFYGGSTDINNTASIGLATSPDGVSFAKSVANPIFQPDGIGFDGLKVSAPVVLVEGDEWWMYYGAQETPHQGPGPDVGLTRSTSPFNNWSHPDQPVLSVGPVGEWDSGWIHARSVIKKGPGQFVMYYGAGKSWLFDGSIGMATSTDGVVWTKYDDPSTTNHPFKFSDPIFKPTEPWEGSLVMSPCIHQVGCRWDMFFNARTPGVNQQIGYATGIDGQHFVRWADNPVLSSDDSWNQFMVMPGCLLEQNGRYMLYYSGFELGFNAEIGLASAPRISNLLLDAEPDQPLAGARLTFTTHPSKPGNLAMLFLTEVNGVPTSINLATGSFTAGQEWAVSYTVPAGLRGIVATFRAFGVDGCDTIVATQKEVVSFQ